MREATELGRDALPPATQRELRDIARQLRDKPRESCRDHGHDTLWRSGLARRVEAVADGGRVAIAREGQQ